MVRTQWLPYHQDEATVPSIIYVVIYANCVWYPFPFPVSVRLMFLPFRSEILV